MVVCLFVSFNKLSETRKINFEITTGSNSSAHPQASVASNPYLEACKFFEVNALY